MLLDGQDDYIFDVYSKNLLYHIEVMDKNATCFEEYPWNTVWNDIRLTKDDIDSVNSNNFGIMLREAPSGVGGPISPQVILSISAVILEGLATNAIWDILKYLGGKIYRTISKRMDKISQEDKERFMATRPYGKIVVNRTSPDEVISERLSISFEFTDVSEEQLDRTIDGIVETVDKFVNR